MTFDDFLWVGIGPDAWLLVDGPDRPTSGVIRAYLIGIEADDWLWRGIGGEGRTTTLEQAMLETQVSVIHALAPDDPPEDLIDHLLDPDH